MLDRRRQQQATTLLQCMLGRFEFEKFDQELQTGSFSAASNAIHFARPEQGAASDEAVASGIVASELAFNSGQFL
jgi:hypothetical protein